MSRRTTYLTGFLGCLLAAGLLLRSVAGASPSVDWSMNATVIEACSCPMFCQCYFNTKPAEHHGHGSAGGHFCRFNNAYRVNKGHYGPTRLDGVKFWMSGDLGGDFSKNQMDWVVVTFDRASSQQQRDAVAAIAALLFPVQWNSMTTSEGDIDTWEFTNDEAHALLDGGKTAEVHLKRFPGMTNEPVVIRNLRYWGAPRNDGFVLMPNERQAYRMGPKAFEFKGTNGFMLTLDISSRDVAASKSTD